MDRGTVLGVVMIVGSAVNVWLTLRRSDMGCYAPTPADDALLEAMTQLQMVVNRSTREQRETSADQILIGTQARVIAMLLDLQGIPPLPPLPPDSEKIA